MGRPVSRGKRVNRVFAIPVELDAWLTVTAHEQAARLHVEPSRTRLVAEALYLLRDLLSGTPSPTSKVLLDDALDRLDAPKVRASAPVAGRRRQRELQARRNTSDG